MADQRPNQNSPKAAATPTPTKPNESTGPTTEGGIFLTKDALIDIIREARRDPRMEAQIEAEAARVKRRRDQMIKLAAMDEKARVTRQRSCRHRKPNGEETSGGQPFSDGRVRIFCLRCQTILREYWTPEVAQGMALQKKMDKLGVTEQELIEAMEFKGEGDPGHDQPDDFALGVPRGGIVNSLTTE